MQKTVAVSQVVVALQAYKASAHAFAIIQQLARRRKQECVQ